MSKPSLYSHVFYLLLCQFLLAGCNNTGNTGQDANLDIFDSTVVSDRSIVYEDVIKGYSDIRADSNTKDLNNGHIQANWVKACGSDLTRVDAMDVALDYAGNIYVAGDYEGKLVCQSSVLTSKGMLDGFLLKFDSNGKVLWGKSLGTKDWDMITSVVVDDLGDIYISGSYSDNVMFGGKKFETGANVARQSFVARIDKAGKVVWYRPISMSGIGGVHKISIDHSGRILSVGTFKGVIGTKGNLLTSKNVDFFVGRISKSGKWLGALKASSTGKIHAFDIADDASGNIYIGGYFSGQASFGNNVIKSEFGWDGFLAKINNGAKFSWAIALSGPGANDQVTSITLDKVGNLISSVTHTGGNIRIGSKTHTSIGGRDSAISMHDSNGKLVWSFNVGGLGNDFAWVHSHGNYIWATGYLWQGGKANNYQMKGNGAAILKINQYGKIIWGTMATGPGYSSLYEAASNGKNEFVSIGGLMETTNLMGIPLTANSVALWDMIIAKFSITQ